MNRRIEELEKQVKELEDLIFMNDTHQINMTKEAVLQCEVKLFTLYGNHRTNRKEQTSKKQENNEEKYNKNLYEEAKKFIQSDLTTSKGRKAEQAYWYYGGFIDAFHAGDIITDEQYTELNALLVELME